MHKIIQYHVYKTFATGIIKSSSSAQLYEVWISLDGQASCDCVRNAFGNLCSHIKCFTDNIELPKNFINPYNDMKLGGKLIMNENQYIPTHSEAINKMIGGGIPISEPIGLYGKYKSGKTILQTQLLCDVVEDGNILVVNTEGDKYIYSAWVERFNKKYNKNFETVFINSKWNKDKSAVDLFYTEPEANQVFYILDMRYIDQILAFHGRGSIFIISKQQGSRKGGKMELIPHADLWKFDVEESPIAHFITENNIKAIGYDSISTPLEEFGSVRQNFPARHTATRWWLLQAHKLIQTYGVLVLANLHETSDPGIPFATPGFVGGKGVGHFFKFLMRIRESTGGKRVLSVDRHPFLNPKSLGALILKLNNEGFEEQ